MHFNLIIMTLQNLTRLFYYFPDPSGWWAAFDLFPYCGKFKLNVNNLIFLCNFYTIIHVLILKYTSQHTTLIFHFLLHLARHCMSLVCVIFPSEWMEAINKSEWCNIRWWLRSKCIMARKCLIVCRVAREHCYCNLSGCLQLEQRGQGAPIKHQTTLYLPLWRACGRLRIYISTRLNSAATHVSTSAVCCVNWIWLIKTGAQMALISFFFGCMQITNSLT